MKITSVDVIALEKDPGCLSRPVLCQVHTDEGITGLGEAGVAIGTGAPAAFHQILDCAPLIIGMDPCWNEVIWEKMFRASFWAQGNGAIVMAAISAIDIALWDIKAKHYGVPVHALLGGKLRDRLRSYASQLQFGWSETRGPLATPEEYAAVAKEAVAQGFDAIKVDFLAFGETIEPGKPFGKWLPIEHTTRLMEPKYIDLFAERVAATREAVGPKVDIIVENHSRTDAQGAIQFGKRIEPYNIYYYEEPTTPSPKQFKHVAENVRIPIASGERIYARWQYFPYFEDSSLHVIQPDLANTGGITEGKKLADAAYAYDVSVQPHVCGSPIIIAATLQLEAAIPNFIIHEHHFPRAKAKEAAIHDYQPVGGYIDVPDLPGIGNELSEYALTQSVKVTVE